MGWAKLIGALADRRHEDPLFGDKVSRRFRALMDDIVRLNRADARSYIPL